MVDEPTGSTRPDDADAADRSVPQHEVEWRDGLSRLISALDDDLGQAIDNARRQASEAVQAIEGRGRELLAELEERRQAAAAEEAAAAERVANVLASIEAAEEELRATRAQADREAETTIAQARRRADAIVAEAEARAAEIIAEARVQAAGGAATSAGVAVEGRDVEGRLRGLSERVGKLLWSPGAAAAGAAAGVAGVAAAGAHGTTEAAPDTAPTEAERTPDATLSDGAYDEDDSPTREVPASAATTDEYRAVEADAQPDEAATTSTPAASAWPPVEAHEEQSDTDVSAAPAPTGEDRDGQVLAGPEGEPERLADVDRAEERAATVGEVSEAPAPETAADESGGTVTQTVIFRSVPNFQAALSLERSLKAMSEVREVRVADFDDRQLTFQVTHELGGQLPRVLLTQRGDELELVEARSERVEFVFRS
jgi:hypothetical protein